MSKKEFIVRTVFVIDEILNDRSAYVKDLEVQVGDELEVSLKIAHFGTAHRLHVQNLRNGLYKVNCTMKNCSNSFMTAFNFHEK